MTYNANLIAHLLRMKKYITTLRHVFFLSILVSPGIVIADYAPGVPNPPIDPNIAVPAQPSSWPSSSTANKYYVDNTSSNATDSDNTYGYPDKPRNSIPEGPFAAGSYVEIHGGPYDQGEEIVLSGDGTSQSPIWVRGTAQDLPVIRSKIVVLGSYIYVEYLQFDRSRRTLGVRAGSNHVLVRRNLLDGPRINDGNTAAMGFSGKVDDRNHDIIFYQNEIKNFGDKSPTTSENDYHGMKASRYCSNIWIIENHTYDMAGDSVQIGDASMPDSERCTKVYIANNNFHDNRENAVDIKNSQDIVIVNNRMANFVGSGSSGGTALVVHNGADNVWIIGNQIDNSEVGVSNTGGTNTWVIANLLTGMTDAGTLDEDTYYGGGVAVHYRGDSSGGVVNNTFHGNQKGVQIASGSNYEITGNIFSGRTATDSFDVMLRTSSIARSTHLANNMYENFSARASSNAYSSINAFDLPDTSGLPSIEGDPRYVNASGNDFRLQDASAAVNASSEADVYATFRSRFGLSIANSLLGQPRPANSTSWDIGAFESTDESIPAPGAPANLR